MGGNMDFEVKKLIVGLLALIISVSLCFVVYNHGKNLNCNECRVNFQQTQQSGMSLSEIISFNVSVLDLREGFLKGECPVEWIDETGFINKNK